MANNELIVDERQTDLGNFIVGRLLPFRKKRQVGPFTFIDHMGPATLREGNYLDVDQHPHIGLCTLTYLFEGSVEHRDSVGSVKTIGPGDVGFMTSGRGVTHTERTPPHMRGKGESVLHGYQIWVALPKAKEEMEPRFDFAPSADLPSWKSGSLAIRLVAGTGFGKTAPIQGYSPMFMVDVAAEDDTVLDLGGNLQGEVAFVIVKGGISIQDQTVNAGQMLVSKMDEHCSIDLKKGSQILLFGGAPLPEERFLLWNFVSHSRDRLRQAKEDWINRAFPKVPGDTTYIPFPNS